MYLGQVIVIQAPICLCKKGYQNSPITTNSGPTSKNGKAMQSGPNGTSPDKGAMGNAAKVNNKTKEKL